MTRDEYKTDLIDYLKACYNNGDHPNITNNGYLGIALDMQSSDASNYMNDIIQELVDGDVIKKGSQVLGPKQLVVITSKIMKI